MCSGPTSRVEGVPIIRAPTITTGFTGLESIAATTTAAVTTMATIPTTGITQPFTGGRIVRGARRCTGVWE